MPSQQITLGLSPIINEVTINGISYPNPTPGVPGGTIVIPEADANALFAQSMHDANTSGGIWLVSSTST